MLSKRHWSALGLAAATAAFWASSGSAITAPSHFSLLDVAGNNTPPIDGFTFNRPPVAGDRFEVRDTLYHWKGTKRGARAGFVEGVATFLSGFGSDFSRRARVLFTVEAHLNGGAVIVEGIGSVNPRGPSRFTFPITGGTGIYANARGYVTVRDLGTGEGNNSNVDIHLMP